MTQEVLLEGYRLVTTQNTLVKIEKVIDYFLFSLYKV